jgi:hypothetical protein
MTTAKPPTLQLVTSKRAKAPARSPRKGPTEDLTAWGIVFEAFEEALKLDVSSSTRRTLLRCGSLAASRAHRSLLRAGGDA